MKDIRKGRASAVIVKDGCILLIKRIRSNEEYYVFPGGGVELSESFEEGLVREIKEETGLDAKSYREIFRLNDAEHGENRFFLVNEATGGEPKLGGPEAQYANRENQFVLEWVSGADLGRATLYPESARKKVLDGKYVPQ